MLDPVNAHMRQKRLLKVLEDRKLDAAVLGISKHVHYFTAHLPFWQNHAAAVIFADGRSALISANSPDPKAAADSLLAYDATWAGTQRQEQPALVAAEVLKLLTGKNATRIGIDASPVTAILATTFGKSCVPIDADVWQLRRAKDPDELRLMRVGIDCCRAMYARARQIIEPGIDEMRVFRELADVATEVAGEPLSDYLGNDYACGIIGGAPRKGRAAAAGELYILDLGPAYRGYFSDTARAISVDRKPTDAQLEAWRVVTEVHPIVQKLAKPGARCRDIYLAVDEYYQQQIDKPFPHHLGHGVGLQPHEFPHLNPKWDDVLIEGEVFTCEPGLYGAELGGGMRIENQYLVTADGVENLTPFPLELA
jgi:Xaa-Pro aminopeptidase